MSKNVKVEKAIGYDGWIPSYSTLEGIKDVGKSKKLRIYTKCARIN
jgi:hypothetical protein